MSQAVRNSAASEAQRATQRSSAVTESTREWDEEVVADIASFDYVRAVVFSDGHGRMLHRLGRMELARDLAEYLDMTLASMSQTGEALAMGELQVGVCIFASGTTISAASRGLRVTILAHGTVNLGQLLSQVRRVFPGSHG